MRFLGKYELLEQLTVGKVETFAAYPIGGGERLLVHVFALPALIKSAPTNRDLVGYMETMSPSALGTVLDAGRYDDGSQAFVVVKLPRDPAALGNWVEAYKALVKTKHDTTAEVVAESLWEEGRGDETREIQVPVKPPGEFTRAFQAAAPPKAPEKSSSPPAAHHEPAPKPLPTEEFFLPEPVRSPAPISLTDEFSIGLGKGSRLAGTPERGMPEPKHEPLANTAPFRIESQDSWKDRNIAQPEPAPVDTNRPGEFTMFFKGPLAPSPEASDPYPAEEPHSPPPPSRPSAGEFTRMFGPATPSASSSPAPAEALLEPVSQGDRFTDLFPTASPSTPEPTPKSVPSPPAEIEPTRGYVVSQNTNFPPEPTFDGRPSFSTPIPGQSRDDNATRLFRTPVQDQPAPPAEPAPPRESEYTRIISAKPQPAPAGKAPAAAAAGSAAALKIPIPIAPPAIPPLQASGPHLAVPPAPAPAPIHLPSVQVQAPKLPQISVPVPPAGKSAKKKGGWTAYIPLIVILNLLLLAGVGLVLYFIFVH